MNSLIKVFFLLLIFTYSSATEAQFGNLIKKGSKEIKKVKKDTKTVKEAKRDAGTIKEDTKDITGVDGSSSKSSKSSSSGGGNYEKYTSEGDTPYYERDGYKEKRMAGPANTKIASFDSYYASSSKKFDDLKAKNYTAEMIRERMANQIRTLESMLAKVENTDPNWFMIPRYGEMINELKGITTKVVADVAINESYEQTLFQYYGTSTYLMPSSVHSSYYDYENSKKLYETIESCSPERMKNTLEEAKADGRDFSNKFEVKQYYKQIEEFKAFCNKFLPDQANRLLDNSFAVKKTGNLEGSMREAEASLFLSKAALTVMPDEQTFLNIKQDAEKAYNAAKAERAAEIEAAMTSDFHREHVNQIVFSSQKITVGKESNIKNTFVPGEPIYAVAYFDKPLRKLVSRSSGVFYSLKSGSGINSWQTDKSIDTEKSYLEFIVLPEFSSDDLLTYGMPVKGLAKLGPRKNELTAGLSLDGTHFSGNLTLDCSSGMDLILKAEERVKKLELASVRFPKVVKKDAGLESYLRSLVNNSAFTNNTYYDTKGATVKRVGVVQSQWTIIRNKWTGIPEYRYIDGAVGLKLSDGKCVYIQVELQQIHDGSGFNQKNFRLRWEKEMLCENMNK